MKLFRREGLAPGDGAGSGVTTSPHWRRGHFRSQPHGPGNTLRKRVFIEPVMVNAEYFLGGTQHTNTSYRQ